MSENNNNANQQKIWEQPYFCKHCGKKVAKHTLKCPHCGKDVVKVTDVYIKDYKKK